MLPTLDTFNNLFLCLYIGCICLEQTLLISSNPSHQGPVPASRPLTLSPPFNLPSTTSPSLSSLQPTINNVPFSLLPSTYHQQRPLLSPSLFHLQFPIIPFSIYIPAPLHETMKRIRYGSGQYRILYHNYKNSILCLKRNQFFFICTNNKLINNKQKIIVLSIIFLIEKGWNFSSILGRIRIHYITKRIQIQIKIKWIHNTDLKCLLGLC